MPTRQQVPEAETSVSAYIKLIRTAETLHAEVNRGLAEHGITSTQFLTLKALHLNGPLPQRDLASRLLRTGGNVTVVVDNLERQGLVTRERDTEDRRMVFVRLTQAGQELFALVRGPHCERIKQAMSPLSASECEQMIGILEKLDSHPGQGCG